MLFHRSDNHFRGELQKTLIESPHQCFGIFGNRHHLCQQPTIPLDDDPFRFLQRIELGQNLRFTLFGVEDHGAFFQDLFIVGYMLYLDRLEIDHTMNESLRAALYPIEFDRYDLVTQAHLKPAYRTDKLILPLSPAHHLAKRHRMNPALDHLSEKLRGLRPLLLFFEVEHFTSIVIDTIQRIEGYAAFSGKTLPCFCHFTVSDRRSDRRPHQLDDTILLTERHRIVFQYQSSGGVEKFKIRRELVLFEQFSPGCFDFVSDFEQWYGRKFFDTDFDKQWLRHLDNPHLIIQMILSKSWLMGGFAFLWLPFGFFWSLFLIFIFVEHIHSLPLIVEFAAVVVSDDDKRDPNKKDQSDDIQYISKFHDFSFNVLAIVIFSNPS